MQLDACDKRSVASRHQFVRGRADHIGGDRDGRRRDDHWAGVPHAHAAVSARPDRDDGGADHHGNEADHHGDHAAPDLARALAHPKTADICIAPCLGNRRRLLVDVAAASACGLRPDWRDHEPAFR